MARKNHTPTLENRMSDERIFAQKLVCLKESITKERIKKVKEEKIAEFIKRISQTDVFNFNDHQCQPISKTERLLVRIDCCGIITTPIKDELLSDSYKKHKTANKDVLPLHGPSEYNLSECPAWKVMQQSKRFKSIKDDVKLSLASQKIDPQILPQLNEGDLLDCLYRTQKDAAPDQRVIIFEGAKITAVKDFINIYENQFREVLRLQNVDKRYVNALVNAMKAKGITSNICVRDKNGDPLNDIKGPEYDIHHDLPVQLTKENSNIFEVNNPVNLKIVQKTPISYHDFIHFASHVKKQKGDIQTRFTLKDKSVLFFASFDKAMQIKVDLNKDKRFVKSDFDHKVIDINYPVKNANTNKKDMANKKSKNNKNSFKMRSSGGRR